MASLLAQMNSARKDLSTNTGACRYQIQATLPFLLQPSFPTVASSNLLRQKVALPASTRMALLRASVVSTRECPPANSIARENPLGIVEFALHGHVAAENRLDLLLAEARGGDDDLAGAALARMAHFVAQVAGARERAVAPLPAGQRGLLVRAPPHDGLLAARARLARGKRLARRARTGVALEDADVRARAHLFLCSNQGRAPIERLTAGLAAGVGSDVEVVGGVPAPGAEAGVGEVLGGHRLHRLAPRAPPPAPAA